MDDEGRFSRNELLFGAEGQARIRMAKVGIVGLGGLGSPTVQQLAYLGVLDYVLVDQDLVTDSSLNRLVGATPGDVDNPKVEIASRGICAVQADAEVVAIEAALPAEEAMEALADRSYIFGCLDRELPRLELTDLASKNRIIYIDSASDVDPDGEWGGRIVVADGRACLFCLGEIDQEELRRESLTPEQREAHDRIYGLKRGSLDEAGPSVVTLNSVVAALAVNEFMVSVTGLTEPVSALTYRGRRRIITRPIDEPMSGCPYCGRWA